MKQHPLAAQKRPGTTEHVLSHFLRMLDAQRRPPRRVGHIKVGEYRLSLGGRQVRIRACLQGEPKARMKIHAPEKPTQHSDNLRHGLTAWKSTVLSRKASTARCMINQAIGACQAA